jgi:hypothetical protein
MDTNTGSAQEVANRVELGTVVGSRSAETPGTDNLPVPDGADGERKGISERGSCVFVCGIMLLIPAYCIDIILVFVTHQFHAGTRAVVCARSSYGTYYNSDNYGDGNEFTEFLFPNRCLLNCAPSCDEPPMRTFEGDPPCEFMYEYSIWDLGCASNEWDPFSKETLAKEACANEIDECLWPGASSGAALPRGAAMPACSCPSLTGIYDAVAPGEWIPYIFWYPVLLIVAFGVGLGVLGCVKDSIGLQLPCSAQCDRCSNWLGARLSPKYILGAWFLLWWCCAGYALSVPAGEGSIEALGGGGGILDGDCANVPSGLESLDTLATTKFTLITVGVVLAVAGFFV